MALPAVPVAFPREQLVEAVADSLKPRRAAGVEQFSVRHTDHLTTIVVSPPTERQSHSQGRHSPNSDCGSQIAPVRCALRATDTLNLCLIGSPEQSQRPRAPMSTTFICAQ